MSSDSEEDDKGHTTARGTPAPPAGDAALPSPSQLWASGDPALWSAVRGRYAAAVAAAAAKGKTKAALPELDGWYLADLPRHLGAASGQPATHITRAQLERLVEWKLARGQWRPRLLAFAREQPAGAVEEASRQALAALRGYRPPTTPPAAGSGAGSGAGSAGGRNPAVPDTPLRAAVEALTALKGVGPATASALLAAACPLVPFMGDEAMAACLPAGRRSDYTLKALLELTALLQDKARQLQSAQDGTMQAGEEPPRGTAGPPAAASLPGGAAAGPTSGAACAPAAGAVQQPGGGSQTSWAAADVERCLWVAAVLHGAPQPGSGAGAGGRAGGAAAGGSSKRARR